MNPLASLLAVVVCMAGAAFFSGVETGVLAVHRLRLRHFVRQGVRRARILQGFLDQPDRLLGTTLVGTNLCVVAMSVVTADFAHESWGAWGEVGSSAVSTLLLLAFAEYLPKAWFYTKPFERCMTFAPLLLVSERVLHPLSAAVLWLSRRLVPAAGQVLAQKDRLTKDELKTLVGQGEKDGVFTARERAMIQRVFELSSKQARDIMVPRAKMVAVNRDTTVADFLAIARRTPFTRMPVYDPAENRYVGIVNLFAVVSAGADSAGKTVAGFVRPLLTIAESMPVDAILPRLRRARQPMCLVTGEKGEVSGLLTVEDILRQIVGVAGGEAAPSAAATGGRK